jgi:hypothetical protein
VQRDGEKDSAFQKRSHCDRECSNNNKGLSKGRK